MWSGAFSLLRVCRSPVGDRVYSLVIGVEAPRSFLSRVSELCCEVGRVGALAPGEEPLSIPLRELSSGRVLCGPQGHPHRSTLVRARSAAVMHLDRLGATEAAQTLSRPRPHMDALRKPRAAKSRSVSAMEAPVLHLDVALL